MGGGDAMMTLSEWIEREAQFTFRCHGCQASIEECREMARMRARIMVTQPGYVLYHGHPGSSVWPWDESPSEVIRLLNLR